MRDTQYIYLSICTQENPQFQCWKTGTFFSVRISLSSLNGRIEKMLTRCMSHYHSLFFFSISLSLSVYSLCSPSFHPANALRWLFFFLLIVALHLRHSHRNDAQDGDGENGTQLIFSYFIYIMREWGRKRDRETDRDRKEKEEEEE